MFVSDISAQNLLSVARGLEPGYHDCVLILLADPPEGLPEALVAGLNEAGISFAGGVFPGLIDGPSCHGNGAVVSLLRGAGRPAVARVNGAGSGWTVDLPTPLASSGGMTALVLLDARAQGLSGFLTELFDRMGNSVGYLGMAAGTADPDDRPVIFASMGLVDNGALVLVLPAASSLAMRHGWQRVGRPMVATRTRGNEILELNWRPACDTYLSWLREEGPDPTLEGLFPLAAVAHPLGILREGEEDVVRNPLRAGPDGSLICLSDVPEQSVLYRLQGRAPALIAAAVEAMQAAVGGAVAEEPVCLICDGFHRSLLLGDALHLELREAHRKLTDRWPDVWAKGVLTWGRSSATASNRWNCTI